MDIFWKKGVLFLYILTMVLKEKCLSLLFKCQKNRKNMSVSRFCFGKMIDRRARLG